MKISVKDWPEVGGQRAEGVEGESQGKFFPGWRAEGGGWRVEAEGKGGRKET